MIKGVLDDRQIVCFSYHDGVLCSVKIKLIWGRTHVYSLLLRQHRKAECFGFDALNEVMPIAWKHDRSHVKNKRKYVVQFGMPLQHQVATDNAGTAIGT